MQSTTSDPTALASSAGKMSRECSVTSPTPSAAFSQLLSEKGTRWNRQGENGQTLVVCLAPKEQRRGGWLTPNISEWPNAAVVCLLSQVLEKGSTPSKYFLSSTACAGILRRAEKRGKTLPPLLHQALMHIARGSAPSEQTVETSGGGLKDWWSDGIADTLLCMAHGQAGAEIRSDGSPSLTCNHEAPIIAFNWNAQPDQMNFSSSTPTLTVSQGPAVCQYGDLAGSLTARHDSSPCADRGMNVVAYCIDGEQNATEGLMGTQRSHQSGGYEGARVAVGFQSSQSGVRLVDTHATLDANMGSRRHNGVLTVLTVRRLTPLECERLQGMPDGHTAIPGAADSPRYKAIGNSKAVPVVRWLGRRISKWLK